MYDNGSAQGLCQKGNEIKQTNKKHTHTHQAKILAFNNTRKTVKTDRTIE